MKLIPKFESEDKERDFWATHDATDYFDRSMKVNLDLSRLKPSTSPITVRLPLTLIWDLKRLANKRDVPYQSLLKILLAKQVKKESRIIDN